MWRLFVNRKDTPGELTELVRLALNIVPKYEDLYRKGYRSVPDLMREARELGAYVSENHVRNRLLKAWRAGRAERVRAKRKDGFLLWMYKVTKKH